jgi:phage terminase large subunit
MIEITPNLRPTPKQWEVYQALARPDVDVVFFGGGAGGGKSWLICESRMVNAIRFPGYKSYIGREELKRLMQSTYLTWCKVSSYLGIPDKSWKLNGQYNFIEFDNGSRIDLLDLKFLPSDPLYERFGSLEYTDGAIEEAGEIDFKAYDVLKSRVGRHMNEEIGVHPTTLITGNPKKNWTYATFYRPYKENRLPKGTVFVQALYQDNRYTAESYGHQLSLITDKQTKERLMLGNWEYDDDPSTLINYDAIIDMFSNSVPNDPDKFLTVDVARFGQDQSVIMLWEGLKVVKTLTYPQNTITRLTDEIRGICRDDSVPYSHVVIDEDGVGGGVVDGLWGVKGFVANSVPVDNPATGDKENFQNLKAQCYYKLAEYINSHKISFQTQDVKIREQLIEELEQVKTKDADKDGKKKIKPKDEVKEILGRSPDFSDTLMMRMYLELEGTPGAVDVNVNRTSSQAYRYGAARMGAVRNGGF